MAGRAQFMAETMVLGTISGLAGASMGLAVTIGAAAAQRWTPIVDLKLVWWAVLLGVVTGMLVGCCRLTAPPESSSRRSTPVGPPGSPADDITIGSGCIEGFSVHV